MALLLPDLDSLDNELSIRLPGRLPLSTTLPELLLSVGGKVDPWLAVETITEPTVGTTDSDVDDEEEVLVEWSGLGSGSPGVDQGSTIVSGGGEVSSLPESSVEVDVHDLEKTSVNVREDVPLGPFDTKGVETLCVGGVESLTLDVVAEPAISRRHRTPVQSG